MSPRVPGMVDPQAPPVSVPATRELGRLLRRTIDRPTPLALLVAEVVSSAAGTVTVILAGATITVPRLTSYTSPSPNSPCYLLASGSMLLAIGEVS